MNRDLETLLDECIDRINEGVSLEKCLASYPEQAEELEPRLRAMLDIRDTLSTMPGATAKAAARQRVDAAQVSLEKRLWKPQRRPLSLFGRSRRVFAPLAIALVLALVGFGLYGVFTPGLTPTVVAQDNFRLLLSDDVSNTTAIGEFESVIVEVLGIGFRKSGGPELLINTTQTDESSGDEVGLSYDLTDYLGPDAVPIWEGHLDPGDYKGVVLYLADDVVGTLVSVNEGGEANEVDIKIPPDKLKLDIPFTIEEDVEVEGDTSINYVFDITVFKDISVVEAGNSGMYILKPVIKESGPDQEFVLHGAKKDKGDIEFKGTISDIVSDDDLILGVTVGDVIYEVIVDENTKVIGELQEGLTVEVEGILQEENVVLASKIKVKKNVEDFEAEIELEGIISAIVSSDDTLTLGVIVGDVTYEVIVDENTKVIGELQEGLTVEVEGVLQEGNDVLASKIKVHKKG